MIFQREFYLLDDLNYSGVTAITMNHDQVVSVMNGNISENTYKNLLVIQKSNQIVTTKRIVDSFASDILIDGNHAYIVGGYSDVKRINGAPK